MSLISITFHNQDAAHLDLTVTVVDDNGSDPASNSPFQLAYGGNDQTIKVTDSGGKKGLIDWTALATGRPPNINTSIAVSDGDTINVAAAAAAPAKAKKDGKI